MPPAWPKWIVLEEQVIVAFVVHRSIWIVHLDAEIKTIIPSLHYLLTKCVLLAGGGEGGREGRRDPLIIELLVSCGVLLGYGIAIDLDLFRNICTDMSGSEILHGTEVHRSSRIVKPPKLSHWEGSKIC